MIYYLSLGSNLGDKTAHLENAAKGLGQLGVIQKKSALYSSEPIGEINQDMFLNAMIKLETESTPFQLLDKIKELEKSIGRTESYRWGPREIDIDIIEYDGPEIKSDKLNIPHLEMEKRKFVLLPLMEIEKDFKTRAGHTINQILQQCPDTTIVETSQDNW